MVMALHGDPGNSGTPGAPGPGPGTQDAGPSSVSGMGMGMEAYGMMGLPMDMNIPMVGMGMGVGMGSAAVPIAAGGTWQPPAPSLAALPVDASKTEPKPAYYKLQFGDDVTGFSYYVRTLSIVIGRNVVQDRPISAAPPPPAITSPPVPPIPPLSAPELAPGPFGETVVGGDMVAENAALSDAAAAAAAFFNDDVGADLNGVSLYPEQSEVSGLESRVSPSRLGEGAKGEGVSDEMAVDASIALNLDDVKPSVPAASITDDGSTKLEATLYSGSSVKDEPVDPLSSAKEMTLTPSILGPQATDMSVPSIDMTAPALPDASGLDSIVPTFELGTFTDADAEALASLALPLDPLDHSELPDPSLLSIDEQPPPPPATKPSATLEHVDVDLGALKSVSRNHAKISYSHDLGGFVLEIWGRNGAWVDNRYYVKGTIVPLGQGSQIQIATRIFSFVLPPSPEGSPTFAQYALDGLDVADLPYPYNLPAEQVGYDEFYGDMSAHAGPGPATAAQMAAAAAAATRTPTTFNAFAAPDGYGLGLDELNGYADHEWMDGLGERDSDNDKDDEEDEDEDESEEESELSELSSEEVVGEDEEDDDEDEEDEDEGEEYEEESEDEDEPESVPTTKKGKKAAAAAAAAAATGKKGSLTKNKRHALDTSPIRQGKAGKGKAASGEVVVGTGMGAGKMPVKGTKSPALVLAMKKPGDKATGAVSGKKAKKAAAAAAAAAAAIESPVKAKTEAMDVDDSEGTPKRKGSKADTTATISPTKKKESKKKSAKAAAKAAAAAAEAAVASAGPGTLAQLEPQMLAQATPIVPVPTPPTLAALAQGQQVDKGAKALGAQAATVPTPPTLAKAVTQQPGPAGTDVAAADVKPIVPRPAGPSQPAVTNANARPPAVAGGPLVPGQVPTAGPGMPGLVKPGQAPGPPGAVRPPVPGTPMAGAPVRPPMPGGVGAQTPAPSPGVVATGARPTPPPLSSSASTPTATPMASNASMVPEGPQPPYYISEVVDNPDRPGHLLCSVPIPPSGAGPRPPPSTILGLDGKTFIGPSPLKPTATFATIIHRALVHLPRGRGTLGEVCNWVAGEWEWFRLNPEAGWQNSIRHNLSLNKAFLKVPRIAEDDPESKGSVWILDPEEGPAFEEKQRRDALKSEGKAKNAEEKRLKERLKAEEKARKQREQRELGTPGAQAGSGMGGGVGVGGGVGGGAHSMPGQHGGQHHPHHPHAAAQMAGRQVHPQMGAMQNRPMQQHMRPPMRAIPPGAGAGGGGTPGASVAAGAGAGAGSAGTGSPAPGAGTGPGPAPTAASASSTPTPAAAQVNKHGIPAKAKINVVMQPITPAMRAKSIIDKTDANGTPLPFVCDGATLVLDQQTFGHLTSDITDKLQQLGAGAIDVLSAWVVNKNKAQAAKAAQQKAGGGKPGAPGVGARVAGNGNAVGQGARVTPGAAGVKPGVAVARPGAPGASKPAGSTGSTPAQAGATTGAGPGSGPTKPLPGPAPPGANLPKVIGMIAEVANARGDVNTVGPNAGALLRYIRVVGVNIDLRVAEQIWATGVIPDPLPKKGEPLGGAGAGAGKPGVRPTQNGAGVGKPMGAGQGQGQGQQGKPGVRPPQAQGLRPPTPGGPGVVRPPVAGAGVGGAVRPGVRPPITTPTGAQATSGTPVRPNPAVTSTLASTGAAGANPLKRKLEDGHATLPPAKVATTSPAPGPGAPRPATTPGPAGPGVSGVPGAAGGPAPRPAATTPTGLASSAKPGSAPGAAGGITSAPTQVATPSNIGATPTVPKATTPAPAAASTPAPAPASAPAPTSLPPAHPAPNDAEQVAKKPKLEAGA